MNAHDVLNALDITDEELLGEVDRLRAAPRKKKASPYIWFALAACLCLLCCGGWFIAKQLCFEPSQSDIQLKEPGTHPTEIANDFETADSSTAFAPISPTEESLLWVPYYNEAKEAIDGALRADVCLFSEELTDEELFSFTPIQKPEWFSPKGYGIFYGDGALRYIYLVGTTSFPETPITISIGTEEPFHCYVLPEEPKASYCNGVEYTITQYTAPDGSVALFAEGKRNDCYYTFSMQGTQDTITQNKTDFTQILQTFAGSSIYPEDLFAVHPRQIPVMFDNPLSHEDACALDPYGSYFLTEVPTGFKTESIRHYQDQNLSYLSGLWTKGYDELSWRVSKLTDEDRHRLTHAEDTRRYDLSLYPIPRADSVPEELREVVDNPIFYTEELTSDLVWARAYKSGEQGDSNGWRMSFSVLYGDTVVTVRCKGIDPDWLYSQMTDLSD